MWKPWPTYRRLSGVGAGWFRDTAPIKCPGTKVYTIIGNVATPGIIEAEMGTTLRDIIYGYAGGIKEGKNSSALSLAEQQVLSRP